MKAVFITLFLFLLTFSSKAQSSRYFTDATYKIEFTTDLQPHSQADVRANRIVLFPSNQPLLSQKITIPLQNAKPFITAALQYDGPSDEQLLEQFAIRFSEDGERWADWIPIYEDMHIPDESRQSAFTGQLIFAQATDKYFQLAIYPKAESAIQFSQIQVVFSAPGETQISSSKSPFGQVNSRSVCPAPAFQGRTDWCSLGECPYGSSPSFTTVTHLIVHHSAGTNFSADWAAVVRAIWHYHVDTHGWDDIGYNWLIDPNGVLYEGRPDNVRGAHFSGHNTGTMGVCVLGNFHDANPKISPKPAAINKLEHLLCWKSEKENLDPLATKYHASSGLNLKVIAGHRDSGSGTACPGDSLYIQLPAIRIYVDSLLHPVSIFSPVKNSGYVTITPTLAQNNIQLKYATDYHPKLTFKIIDPSGKVVQLADFQSDIMIDISNLSSGMYFVQIVGKDISDVFRVFKN
ncbi:MAG TPA: T9SS type A sorting domain-containing protein [Saprospiraceae bacterium]|nr:T9SS type A sorting domain-containing protein [Saprospiraceae bacterium]